MSRGRRDNDTFYLADSESSRETIAVSVQTGTECRPDSLPIVAALRTSLRVEEAEVSVALPRSSLAQLLGLRGSGYELSGLGRTPQEARARAGQIVQELQEADPSVTIHVAEASPVEELHYTPNRESLARSEATVSTVAGTTWEALEGAVSTKLASGDGNTTCGSSSHRLTAPIASRWLRCACAHRLAALWKPQRLSR